MRALFFGLTAPNFYCYISAVIAFCYSFFLSPIYTIGFFFAQIPMGPPWHFDYRGGLDARKTASFWVFMNIIII